ncbi:unnamed protein product [Closterium sp. NIES-65]|nr:unnamed protein product [Closterium sp. NIES-65]
MAPASSSWLLDAVIRPSLSAVLPTDLPVSLRHSLLPLSDSPYFTAAVTLAERTHQQLHDAGLAFQSIPFDLIIVGHALATSAAVRMPLLRRHWLLCFWAAFFTGYGGGTLTSLLLHVRASLCMCLLRVIGDHFVWLRNDSVLLLFALCWWVITYSPYDVGSRLYALTPVKLVARVAASIARTGVVISRIDRAVGLFGKHALVAPVFIGTLAGCGGRLILDLVLALLTASPPSRSELLYPSWLSRSACIMAVGYTLAVHWAACCTSQAAFAAIASLLMAHSAWEVISGSPWDPTAPLSTLFHSLLCIPLAPATLPSPKPSTTTPSPAHPLPHPPTQLNGHSSSSKGQGASQGIQQQRRGEGESSSRFESTPVGGKAARHRKPQRA